MPRHPRLDASGVLHHVIGRGIHGVKIFSDRKDREELWVILVRMLRAFLV
ncbi:MAG: hypothetical protein ACNYWU_01090 [Desulfobacterales bacterium]